VLALFALAVVFLLMRSLPVVTNARESEAAISSFSAGHATSLLHYLGPLVFATLLSSLLALALSVPIAVLVAVFIAEYARGKVRSIFSSVVDVLAAIPSVIYGLWGALVFVPASGGFWQWLSSVLGWIPLFAGPASHPARTMASAAVVLALMVVPIVITMCRDAFLQTPQQDKEAALALGATKWEMVTAVVLPEARSAIVVGSVLGLGRALGETMAVLMILSPASTYSFNILQSTQNQTIAANIAAQFPEANGSGVGLLIFTGVVLFVISFIVNAIAHGVAKRLGAATGEVAGGGNS
jgi:phosphate transport system permease protein